ncbi:MAG: zinc dependent phospholipase C family protein [Firmicutes bacterium]|nr:zinc dependent phospholipase C family protein [Bacillota bacterium]
MGKNVLSRLEDEIASSIDYDIFRLVVMGPDSFIYYRFFAPLLRHNHNKRSSVMHSEHTGSYLVELAKRTREYKSKELFSYLAGFLCHYSLDGKTHPTVNRLSGSDMHKHLAIERKLDQIVLQKQGKALMDRPITNELFRAVQYPISWNRTVSFDSNILGWYTLSLKCGLFNGGVLIHAKKAYPDCFV